VSKNKVSETGKQSMAENKNKRIILEALDFGSSLKLGQLFSKTFHLTELYFITLVNPCM
jgi:hypothetical protein